MDAVGWISALSRVVVPIPAPTTSTEIVNQIIEAARTCPVDGCPSPSITVGEAAAIVLWVTDQAAHDDALIALENEMAVRPTLSAKKVAASRPNARCSSRRTGWRRRASWSGMYFPEWA